MIIINYPAASCGELTRERLKYEWKIQELALIPTLTGGEVPRWINFFTPFQEKILKRCKNLNYSSW
jgi:hypothetical protein